MRLTCTSRRKGEVLSSARWGGGERGWEGSETPGGFEAFQLPTPGPRLATSQAWRAPCPWWVTEDTEEVTPPASHQTQITTQNRDTHAETNPQGCQRIARRDKKAFLSDQCKEIEENNRMGKTRDLLKKIRDTPGTFHRGVRPRLEGKPRTPLSSRVATRAVMNIGVHVTLSILVSSVCIPSSGIAGS